MQFEYKRIKSLTGVVAALALLVVAASCVSNEFLVRFKLDKSVNSTYRIVYYASDANGGVLIETAVAVTAGKSEVKGITRFPCMVSVYNGRDIVPACVFFAERGDEIEITGSEASPLSWSIDGNKTNKRLTEWRLANKQILEDVINARTDDEKTARTKLNAAVRKFVEEDPGAAASLVLMSAYYDSSIAPKEYRRLTDMLQESGVMDEYPTLMARHDRLSAVQPAPEDGGGRRQKDIVVKSFGRNIDTLRFASGKKPGLLYLWHRDDDTRRADVDSMRGIVKWRGDSARMTVADLCLDMDSAVWVNIVRSDSLRSTLRGWAPRGLADPDLMEMGVASTPWWIVTSRDGKVVYSGQDAAKAMARLRSVGK